jgi:hypothetical protein
VVLGDYREFLVAIAGAAGSLTGLLFVALSVAPRHPLNPGPTVIQQVRATAALLSFSNALAVSLFGLVPGNNVGYPAVVLGVIGILFTAAGAGRDQLQDDRGPGRGPIPRADRNTVRGPASKRTRH